MRSRSQPVSSSVFVTGVLYALSLPPATPLWIAGIGIVFGIVFAKMAFGGFGKNVFNPAISARAFIYITFPFHVNSPKNFFEPIGGFLHGFARFLPDTVSRATPLAVLKSGGTVPLLNLLMGNTSGSAGETMAVLILAGGIYLMITKTANFRIVAAGAAGFFLFQTVFWLAGIKTAPEPLHAALAGSFLYALMFMTTDPVSASQTTNTGRWIYGAFIGIMIVVIRTFSSWAESVTFAVLLGNMFGPLLNYIVKSVQTGKKVKNEQ